MHERPANSPQVQREEGENPLYKSWAGFPKGTTVAHQAVTAVAGNPAVTTTTTTYTLLERTDEQVVVEMQAFTRRYDGTEINNPPQQLTNPRRIRLPPGMTRSDVEPSAPGLGQGKETLRVGAHAYATKRSRSKDRNEAGEVLVQTWTSDQVPGGLVKSITQTPAIGKTTTLQLIEVKIP